MTAHTLSQLLEKFIGRSVTVEIGAETYEVLHALNFALSRADLEREVIAHRVEGNPSEMLVWFADSESDTPDYILHDVPRPRGRPSEDKRTRAYTLDKALVEFLDHLPEGERSQFVNDWLRQHPNVAEALKEKNAQE